MRSPYLRFIKNHEDSTNNRLVIATSTVGTVTLTLFQTDGYRNLVIYVDGGGIDEIQIVQKKGSRR